MHVNILYGSLLTVTNTAIILYLLGRATSIKALSEKNTNHIIASAASALQLKYRVRRTPISNLKKLGNN